MPSLKPKTKIAWSGFGQSWIVVNAPFILRTCKQIYNEAVPILYSGNTFMLSHPEHNLEWLDQIGPFNAKLLKHLRIFPHAVWCSEPVDWMGCRTESPFWCKILDQIARTATGLKYVYVFWDSEPSCGHFGAGRDLRFVRELAKFRGLQTLVISGFYAIHWPSYLTREIGVQVQEEDPACYGFRNFQRGTENLIP